MNPVCEKMINYYPVGDMVPVTWYTNIRKGKNKPDLEAILILANIMYWYRPTEIRSESTNELIGYRQKFQADKLQKSYQQYAHFLGIPKSSVKRAIDNLVKLGLITREFRKVNIGNGIKLSNVMYVEPVLENITQITQVVNKEILEDHPQEILEDPPSEILGEGGGREILGDIYIDYSLNSSTKNTHTKDISVTYFPSTSREYLLTKNLYNKIIANNQSIKKKYEKCTEKQIDSMLQKWCVHIDRLLRIDNQEADDIQKVIDFVFEDDFWSVIIQSAKGLRNNYFKIYPKAIKNNKQHGILSVSDFLKGDKK